MANKHPQREFEFRYNLDTASYISPDDERAGYNETSPYGRVFLTAFSKRFRERDEAEFGDITTPEEDVTPTEDSIVEGPECSEENIDDNDVPAPTSVAKAKTVYKKNKGCIAFALISAIASLALLVLMFFNVMVPQLSSITHIGNQVVDVTGSGSLYYVQTALLVVAALLIVAIIVGFVQAASKKRLYMGIASLLAFLVLIGLGLLCIMEVPFAGVKFYEGFINFKDPFSAYEFKFLLDIPGGYFIVAFLALLSFILSCCGYTKLGKEVAPAPQIIDEPEVTEEPVED